MKIATLNIGEDERNKDGKLNINSYKAITNFIARENVDIICLQEAIIKSDILPPIAEFIKENTYLKYIAQFELSDSHINIGSRMGIVICSKYKIDAFKTIMFDNPKFIYSKDQNTTYYSHDKGFIIADINDYKIITGHTLPFHVFNESPLDYLNIFKKMDDEFIKAYNLNNKLILCGDFNYEDAATLFPQIMEHCIDLIDVPTRKDKEFDHFIISNKLKCSSKIINDCIFDHKYGLFEVDDEEI